MSKTKAKKGGKCEKCGAATNGQGSLCFVCLAKEATFVDKSAASGVAERVKERLGKGDLGGPICPFCRITLSFDNLSYIETEVTIYVREKIYYCPACRAFLGASSWHTEG